MSFQTLPPELDDYVLDFLHDDRAALKACSLTCKSWRPVARYHLFRCITWYATYDEAFGQMLAESPDIARVIHDLAVSGLETKVSRKGIIPEKSQENNAYSPAKTTLASLTFVQKLDISHLGIDAPLHANLLHLCSIAPITYLTLTHCRFPTFGHFTELLCSLPNLDILSLSFVTWDSPDSAPPNYEHSRPVPKPSQLDLGRGLQTSKIADWLAEDVASNVTSFSLCSTSGKDLAACIPLVRSLNPSLRKFELEMLNTTGNGALCLPDGFPVEHLTHLQTLHLHCPIYYNQTLPWVTSLIDQVPSQTIEKVRLDIRALGSLDGISWSSLQTAMSSKLYPRLKTVEMEALVARDIRPKDVPLEVAKRVPELQESNLLHFLTL